MNGDQMSLAEDQAKRAKVASFQLRRAQAGAKSAAIRAMGARLKSRLPDILEANKADLAQAKAERLSDAKLDRLKLDEKRIDEVVKGLEAVASQPDPVSKVYDERKAPSGITCKRVRVPIGVILMIFESRPNVTAEAAALCLRSSNAVLLKGGHEAERTNRVIAACLQGALAQEGLPSDAVQLVEGGHEAVDELLKLENFIDLVIPRGGESLIRSVAEKSRIPVIRHYKGNCHVYVDEAADPIMARTIVTNAKTQRPATCNAAEKLLIHEKVAEKMLPQIAERLLKAGVKLRGDATARRLVPDIKAATEEDWSEEYLDLIMAVKVVKDVDEAIRHINVYGSAHTDAIVTGNETTARKFLNEVDSSSVMWNCSTRLADGGQYGLGAEIGISTGRLHARGPMGAEELTCLKWVVTGNGELRQ
ncbi:MAG TPA: glutamate-5-semialdehyde dehydrogenase [Planctomycetota bacterium]|nr:glutamate-5-semialdehyde dehydrogenase [Planctomycetota bacterium]